MTLINWKASPGDRIPAGDQNRPRYLVDGRALPWDGPSFEVKSPVFEEGPGGWAPRGPGVFRVDCLEMGSRRKRAWTSGGCHVVEALE